MVLGSALGRILVEQLRMTLDSVAFGHLSGELFNPLHAPALVVALAQLSANLGERLVDGRLLPGVGREEESVRVLDQRCGIARSLQLENRCADSAEKAGPDPEPCAGR